MGRVIDRCITVLFVPHGRTDASTHLFKRVEADILADVAVLVEAILGKGAALYIHAELREEQHDLLVRLGPRLTVLLAANDVI